MRTIAVFVAILFGSTVFGGSEAVADTGADTADTADTGAEDSSSGSDDTEDSDTALAVDGLTASDVSGDTGGPPSCAVLPGTGAVLGVLFVGGLGLGRRRRSSDQ